MGKSPSHKGQRKYVKRVREVSRCERQFPDCPETQDAKHCGSCPYYKKPTLLVSEEEETPE